MAKVLYSNVVSPGLYSYKFTSNSIELEKADKEWSHQNYVRVKPVKGIKLFYLMYVSGELKIMPVKESYVEIDE